MDKDVLGGKKICKKKARDGAGVMNHGTFNGKFYSCTEI